MGNAVAAESEEEGKGNVDDKVWFSQLCKNLITSSP